ncbi:MAG: 50S ribosomal protein L25/general stress protein Ctc [Waddliaceae bacterium]
MFKLQTKARKAETKGETNQLRREGCIPAVIYAHGTSGKSVSISGVEFDACMRNVRKGHLSTTRFNLVDENGEKAEAVIKEIQYNPTNYQPIHIDFEELVQDVPVNIKVPIECVGVADCVGIKLGGVLRQVIRSLKVRCLPKDIPSEFKIDVRKLQIKEKRRLSDLKIPETVRPLAKLQEVAVVIAKR